MIIPEELQHIEFLRNLGDQYLNQVALMANLKEYQENTIIFHQGEGSQLIYIVLSGQVALQVEESGGASVEVSTLEPGELLGWSPVLGRHAMTATARARTACRLAVLEVQQVMDLCQRDPRFGIAFLQQIALVLSDRLWVTRRNLARALSHRPLLATAAEGSD